MGIFQGLGVMTFLVVLVMGAVIVAMAVDCVSGWRKAKLRGDERTSYAFSRSLTKFLIYEGMVLIGGCMDFMIHFVWVQFMVGVYYVPCLTTAIGIVLCVVEIWSVKEKADKKARKKIDAAAAALAKILDKETVMEFLRTQMKEKDAAAVAAQYSADSGELHDGEAELRRTELVSDDF